MGKDRGNPSAPAPRWSCSGDGAWGARPGSPPGVGQAPSSTVPETPAGDVGGEAFLPMKIHRLGLETSKAKKKKKNQQNAAKRDTSLQK